MIKGFQKFDPDKTSRRFNGGLITFTALIAFMLMAGSSSAVVPLSPNLERGSQDRLQQELVRAGISETGQSAVVIALLNVLGSQPKNGGYQYREPYPQLPDVDATAQRVGRSCSQVELDIVPKAERQQSVILSGRFCLSKPRKHTWRIRSLEVRRARDVGAGR